MLVFGLWRLQVVGGQNYHALAEANRIRKVPILAPRGKLFDREGRLLVDNYPSVSCFLVREQGHDITPDLPLISRGLHMTADQIDAIIKTLPHRAQIPAPSAQAGHHPRRSRIHRGPQRRASRTGNHSGAAPPLSPRRIRRPSHRLRWRSQRRYAQRSSLRHV